ncbi:MAG: phospholipase D-like domain-containing protein [Planctomycetota bacterium]
MTHHLTRSSGLALALLLALGLHAPAQAQYTPQAYFSPNGGGADATAELIDKATATLDVGMYSISTSGPIWEALKRAIGRGVVVRVVLDGATSANKSKAQALENLGAHVFGVSRTMHQKFALVDAGIWYRRKLVNGSANWSSGAETRYSENTVVYGSHYHLFYAFQQEFNRLLADAQPVSANAGAHQQPVSLSAPSSKVKRYERAVFTSQNSGSSTVVADEIIALMQQAQNSIEIDVAHFNSRAIADALIAIHKAKPQVRIEVLVDLGEYADSKSRARDLEKGGIPVRYKTYSLAWVHPRSQLQHHKTILVDGRDLITGSYNWSDTAENSNYENIIVIQGHVSRNKPLAAVFEAEHRRLWDQNRDLYAPFLQALRSQPGDPDYRRYVPIHFDTNYHQGPMALTRSELQKIRSAAWSAGVFNRQPDGKPNSQFSYLDKETKDVFKGTPSGSFLPNVNASTVNGLTNALTNSNGNGANNGGNDEVDPAD